MKKIGWFLIAVVAAAFCGGCTATGVSDNDQKALEKKYSQSGYKDAMKSAGREKEYEAQQKLEKERGRGD